MIMTQVYLVWSKTFDSPIGVYDSEEVAKKISASNNGKIYPLVMNGAHSGHLQSVYVIFGNDVGDIVANITQEL
jgi:hypothetical protein